MKFLLTRRRFRQISAADQPIDLRAILAEKLKAEKRTALSPEAQAFIAALEDTNKAAE